MKQRLTILTFTLLALAALFVFPASASPLLQATNTPTITPTNSADAGWWPYTAAIDCYAVYGSNCIKSFNPCGSGSIASFRAQWEVVEENGYAQWGMKLNTVLSSTTQISGTWLNSNISWTNDLLDAYAFGVRTYGNAAVHLTNLLQGSGGTFELFRRDFYSYQGTAGRIYVGTASGYCYGRQTEATYDNLIKDGDMEMDAVDSWWDTGMYPDKTYYFNVHPPESLEIYEPVFGRITPFLGPLDGILYDGGAACNRRFQATGPMRGSWNLIEGGPFFGQDIWQQFTVPTTGHVYWKVKARNRQYHLMDSVVLSGQDTTSTAIVYLTDQENTQRYYLLDNVEMTEDGWVTFMGTLYNLPAGQYIIHLSHYKPDLNTDYWNDLETVYYDDISLGYTPRSAECDLDENGEYLPTITFTPGVGPGTPTPEIVTPNPTRTRTITPTFNPVQFTIQNCDFEQGKLFWNWNTTSQVGYSSGPVGPMYGGALPDQQSVPISRTITSPHAGLMYFKGWVRGNPDIYLEDVTTHARWYLNPPVGYYPTIASEWTQISTYAHNVPAGNYRLVLGTKSTFVTTDYDGIGLALDGIPTGYCVNATPTPGPTAAKTATLAPTRTGTTTLLPGTMTPATPMPSQTLGPTRTGTRTVYYVTRTGTITPGGPTLTPGAGFTPIPNWTPGPLTTPAAGFLDCSPPGGLDWLWVGAWFEYERCQAINFVSFQPRHAQTAAALPHILDDRFPFGAINEGQESVDLIRLMVSAYPWGNQTLEGVNNYTNPLTLMQNPENGPLNGGSLNIDLTAREEPDMSCSTPLVEIVGDANAGILCMIINFLVSTGALPWLQLIINLGSIAGVLFYIYERWIEPGMNS